MSQSANGWMEKDIFLSFLLHHFYDYLVKKGVKFPVILYVDRHSTHVTVEAAELCKKLGIILIGLLPNCTRILQPLDRCVFGPFKSYWKKLFSKWRLENNKENLPIEQFSKLLKETNKASISRELIMKSFKTCGLHPWDVSAIDPAMCIGKDPPVDSPFSPIIVTPNAKMTYNEIEAKVNQLIGRMKILLSTISEYSSSFELKRTLIEIDSIQLWCKSLDNQLVAILNRDTLNSINELTEGKAKILKDRRIVGASSVVNNNYTHNPPLDIILKPKEKVARKATVKYQRKLFAILSAGEGLQSLRKARLEKEEKQSKILDRKKKRDSDVNEPPKKKLVR